MIRFIFPVLLCMLCLCCLTACGDTEDISGVSPEIPSEELVLKDALADLQHAPSFTMWLCAHRGNTQEGIENNIPENSLAALRKAITLGIDMVELDVRMTSDGVLVLMHDASIDRTTNGQGNVANMTYEALQQYRLKSGTIVSEETIPTLEEALAESKGKIFLNLDIANKDIPAQKIVGLLEEQAMLEQVALYISTDRNYAMDLTAANGKVLLHPMIENTEDIDFYSSHFPSECVLMQLSTEDAMEGILSKEIAGAGFPVFSNIVGRYDEYALKGNYSGLVNMINKRNHIIQTDYYEIADYYLISKGYR